MGVAGKKIAFMFPGQGSQKVGMGRVWAEAVPEARAAFEEADEALGFSLSRLCWEGPEEELGLTENTQPALVATSIAVHRALGVLAPELMPVAMAGHSLGEYSALVAAGSLGFADALRLVRRRGQLMQEAVPVGVGAMAAVIGMDPEAIAAVAADAADAERGEICAVANLNGPAQTVLAGHKAAVDRAVVLAKERGARKATLLAVSAPFHSPLMRPAREGLAPLLAATPFQNPKIPVVSNVDAVPVASGDAAREALERQIDSPVRWVESVRWMEDVAGVEVFVEVGPGNVLAGLTRRIVRGDQGARTTAVSDPDHLRQILTEDD
ncbi:MAG TPA: ACP S-malonyltransferase [Thermoanaerobaculia bacterium]|jgi:[acyl-carrier-protein] S-malonyltransferase|nr:ACP S-malonyltransferase [Thermoanaerobaculia bacterium]